MLTCLSVEKKNELDIGILCSSYVTFIKYTGACRAASTTMCALESKTCCPVTLACGSEQAFGKGIQRNSRCVCRLLSVVRMGLCVGVQSSWRRVYLRAAEGRGELAFLISFCGLVWWAGSGSAPCQEGTERWWLKSDPFRFEPVMKRAELIHAVSNSSVHVLVFLCSLQSSALVNLVHTPVVDNAGGGVSLSDYDRISV